jgi:SAM-dependent methyltransferase
LNVFSKYAEFYDLLYQDKDYAAEANYVECFIKKHFTDTCSILELGCGTGVNAELMAKKGYQVLGVDISEEMLRLANERKLNLNDESAVKLTFCHSDIGHLQLSECFDVVISLFHVASYQASNNKLTAMFSTAARHLKRGGIFIFDFWYGPAVLTDQPTVRTKRFENENYKITRIAEPFMNANENTVDIKFHFIVFNKKIKENVEFCETHKMRYLFMPEIELMLCNAGFEIMERRKWMCEEDLGFESWNGVCLAKKISDSISLLYG